MKTSLFALGLFSASYAFSADIFAHERNEPVEGGPRNGYCITAKSDLRYEASHYQGGPAPYPGLVTLEQKLVHDKKLVGHTIIREGEEPEYPQPWLYNLSFIAETKYVVSSTGNQMSGSEIYVQDVEVTRLDGLGPTMEHKSFLTRMLCRNSWAILP